MKAKLIKIDKGYYNLEDKKDNILGTSYQFNSSVGDVLKYKLSQQNCDKIFGVVDVEKLAEQEFDKPYIVDMGTNITPAYQDGFKIGFNKAMEMNKDKVFTLKDVKQAIFNFANYDRKTISELDRMDMAVSSIQQPTEIEVEIEMEIIREQLSPGATYIEDSDWATVTQVPKLDSEGCLILKKQKQ